MFMQRSVFGSRIRSVDSDEIRKVHQHNASFDRNYICNVEKPAPA